MTTEAQEPLRVFCSYSRKDEDYLNDLRVWLRPFERQSLIAWWHDREIIPGQEWREAIEENLQAANIILLLISPDFMASDFAYEQEMQQAIARHERGEASVIPIIVRRADLEGAPFKHLQSLPTDLRPVAAWPDRDEAWYDVVNGIKEVVKRLLHELNKRIQEAQAAMEQYRKVLEQPVTTAQRGRSGGQTLPNYSEALSNIDHFHSPGGFGGQSTEILSVTGPKLAAKERALSGLRAKIAAGEELSQTEKLQYQDLMQQQDQLFKFSQNAFTSERDKIKQWTQSLGRI
jgi:hypothetical protein